MVSKLKLVEEELNEILEDNHARSLSTLSRLLTQVRTTLKYMISKITLNCYLIVFDSLKVIEHVSLFNDGGLF